MSCQEFAFFIELPAAQRYLLLHAQVFLGDQSVGKTSIITRFMYDKFDNTYQVCWADSAVLSCGAAGRV